MPVHQTSESHAKQAVAFAIRRGSRQKQAKSAVLPMRLCQGRILRLGDVSGGSGEPHPEGHFDLQLTIPLGATAGAGT